MVYISHIEFKLVEFKHFYASKRSVHVESLFYQLLFPTN